MKDSKAIAIWPIVIHGEAWNITNPRKSSRITSTEIILTIYSLFNWDLGIRLIGQIYSFIHNRKTPRYRCQLKHTIVRNPKFASFIYPSPCIINCKIRFRIFSSNRIPALYSTGTSGIYTLVFSCLHFTLMKKIII